ncbi:MAG: hypothetical protein ACI4SB_04420 [Acutalibacteraceae bacterium]
MNSKRIVWIDRFKAVGFFFVVPGHLEIGDNLKFFSYAAVS